MAKPPQWSLFSAAEPNWPSVLLLMAIMLVISVIHAYRDWTRTSLVKSVCTFALVCTAFLLSRNEEIPALIVGVPAGTAMVVFSISDYANRVSLTMLATAGFTSGIVAATSTIFGRIPAVSMSILSAIFWVALLVKCRRLGSQREL